MAIYDKLNSIAKKIEEKTEDVIDATKAIGDKTLDAIEIAKLNSKIDSHKKEINRLKLVIGEYYYALMDKGEIVNEDLRNILEEIKFQNKCISATQSEINKIKN